MVLSGPEDESVVRVTFALARRWPVMLLLGVLVVAVAGGAGAGYFLKLDLPDIRGLDDYTPPLMTRVLAADGTPVGSFAQERRVLISYSEIPESFRAALIAVEDSRFLEHPGVDVHGVARAAWHDITRLRLAQGASTITQQLARGLFLTPAKVWKRKFQEMILALEIERNYSKQEILTFYCNQVYMGHGQYGLEAAARHYFGKAASELTLPESALLAGLVQRPEALTPFRNPELAVQRRNHVLRRMQKEGYISEAERVAAIQAPLVLSSERVAANPAPYFVEEVRRWLQGRLGSDTSVYTAGMEVRTTLDPRLQDAANGAVDFGLRELDKRQGWRGVSERVPDGEDPAAWEDPAWSLGVEVGTIARGVVVGESRDSGKVTVRVGPLQGTLTPEDVSWTRKRTPASFLDVGDIIEVRIVKLDDSGADLALEQEPEVEAALIAIEPSTGAIRALVGGFDFERSEFDRAIQARRQAGSAFKPFVYAAALNSGWTPAQTLLDEPTVLLDTQTLQAYQPENFGNEYHGTVTLREALAKSDNIATVKLLLETGYDPVIAMARKLGITTELQPYPSMALGAFELSLVELTSAYGTFANEGVRVEPHLVEEVLAHDGTVLETVTPEVEGAVSPQVAYLMNELLKGVIADGTGRAAQSLGRTLAGKTGTTDDSTDAWFVGYTPDLVVGVWVGFDVKRSLGKMETGARAALPIWQEFMRVAYDDRPTEEFARPPRVVEVPIDGVTGLRANPSAGCSPVIAESFIEGSEPTQYCSPAEHVRLRLPRGFQRYALDEHGELVVPSWALDELLLTEPYVRLSADGRQLEAITAAGFETLPVRQILEPAPEILTTHLLERLAREEIDPATWIGKDGKPARIEILGR
jgi:penicillin-binding protein 1A